MTLPRKKSRSIEIEGRTFRWMLSGRKPRHAGNAYTVATFTAQEDIENPGAVMQAKLQALGRGPFDEPDNGIEEPLKAAITPRDVTRMILSALIAGWDPNGTRRGVFKLQGPLVLEDYEVI